MENIVIDLENTKYTMQISLRQITTVREVLLLHINNSVSVFVVFLSGFGKQTILTKNLLNYLNIMFLNGLS